MKKRNKFLSLLVTGVMALTMTFGLTGCRTLIGAFNGFGTKEDSSSTEDNTLGTEYKFEAEDSRVELVGGKGGGLGTASESGTNETYIGGFNANKDASITYYIHSPVDTKATLMVSVCKRTIDSVFSNVVTTTVNNKVIKSSAIVPAIQEGESDWVTFVDVNLGKVNLVKGTNVICFTVLGEDAMTGFNFNRMSLYTKDAEATPTLQEAPVAQTYYFEAENADSNAWGTEANTNFVKDLNVPSAHGGGVARGIGENAGKGYYFEFKFKSAESRTATLYLIWAAPFGVDIDTTFPVSVNGSLVTTNRGVVQTNGWEDYQEFELVKLNIQAGDNTIRFMVNTGCTVNFDAIKLVTTATLT